MLFPINIMIVSSIVSLKAHFNFARKTLHGGKHKSIMTQILFQKLVINALQL